LSSGADHLDRRSLLGYCWPPCLVLVQPAKFVSAYALTGE